MQLQGWEFSQTGSGEWRSAVVPGCVHLDLLRQGLIPDPHFSTNERDVQWVDEVGWSYRYRFDWRPGEPSVLHFEGLDTVCRVLLNGVKVAEHENMFVPLTVDVASVLVTGRNEVMVEFEPAAVVGSARLRQFVQAEGIAEDTACLFDRSFVRKAQYMFGWDWGPRLVSCGIWKPVTLDERNTTAQRETTTTTQRHNVELRRVPDELGESFEFIVDGKPFWAKGANWIPDHSFPSEVTPERLRKRLEQAKDLGCNMLRVWGGGYYEQDVFYDICDELDILVWQDFMFSCAYYPDRGPFADEVRREAEYQVERLRHHACIALWCGNNENQMMFAQGWGDKDKQPPRFFGQHLYDEVLREVVERLDPGRPYVPGSPIGGADPNADWSGDQHYWEVWHGKGDWVHYKDSGARFCSEFGFASSPSMAVWNSCLRPEERELHSEAQHWHDKTLKPWEKFLGYVTEHYPEPKTLEDWVYYSQLNQRDAMRAAVEHFRSSRFCKGALIWQLNDCWPSQSWSLIDFAGRYKAAAYEVKRLFAESLLCILGDKKTWAYEVNDYDPHPWRGVQTLAYDVFQPVSERRRWVVEHGNAVPTQALIHVAFRDISTWRLLCEPKELKLPLQKLYVHGLKHKIQIWHEYPIVDLWLIDADDEFEFDPNFITSISGHIKVQTDCPIERLRMRSLAGEHPIEFVPGGGPKHLTRQKPRNVSYDTE